MDGNYPYLLTIQIQTQTSVWRCSLWILFKLIFFSRNFLFGETVKSRQPGWRPLSSLSSKFTSSTWPTRQAFWRGKNLNYRKLDPSSMSKFQITSIEYDFLIDVTKKVFFNDVTHSLWSFLNTAHFKGCHEITSQDLSFIFLPFYNDVISKVSDDQSMILNSVSQPMGGRNYLVCRKTCLIFVEIPIPPHITT
jgi:hypothetical protein